MHKTKRFFSKFIVVFLVGVIALSAGCGGKQEEAGQGEVINKVEYSGTHNYTAKQTADFLVKDGKTEYKLVVPKAQTDKLKMAKEEFLYFFEQATGISMSIIYDTDDADNSLTHDKDNKYVSIGNTTLALTANVSTEGYDLGNDGVRIETKDKTIFLLGGSDTGVIYAVYDFMKIEFGYEQYAADCFAIDKGVTDVTLKNYDVTDIPDIAIRVYSSRVIQQRHNTGYDGKMYKYRMDELVKRFKKLRLVAAHPGEYDCYLRHMKRMNANENYYLDLSGTGIFRYGLLRRMIDEFGASRFIFGSDYPTCNLAMFVGGVALDDLISEEEKKQIFYSNAAKLLNIN